MLDPLGNGDERQAIGPKRGPDRNAQQKMRGPCGLPALRKAEHTGRRAKTNRAAKRTAQKPFRRIEISDWQTSAKIEE